MKRALALLAVVLIAAIGLASPAMAATHYSSCAALLKDYPRGVANTASAAVGAVNAGYAQPSIRASIYQANGGRLDPNDNGVMCETKKGASSTPMSTDQRGFVKQVFDEYPQLRVLTDAQLLSVGKGICKTLDNGGEMDALLDQLLDYELPDGAAGTLLGASIAWLCPGHSKYLDNYVAS